MTATHTLNTTTRFQTADGMIECVTDQLPSSEILAPGFYRYDQRNVYRLAFFKTDFVDSKVDVIDPAHERIVERYKNFWSIGDKYRELGTPHRRGFLLHGPAGTGKSTLLRILVQYTIDAGGVVIKAGNIGELGAAVKCARWNRPDSSPVMILFEDIDEYGDSSELTDVFDGVGSMEGVAFVATTNHLDKIPPRFRNRPGRFDDVLLVDYMSKSTRRAFIEWMVRNRPEKSDVDFVTRLTDATEDQSVAIIREVVNRVLLFGASIEDAVADFTPEGEQRRQNDMKASLRDERKAASAAVANTQVVGGILRGG